MRAGVPAAVFATSLDRVDSDDWDERGFIKRTAPALSRAPPGAPASAGFGWISGVAPELGADIDIVLREVLGLPTDEIAALRHSGATG